MSHLQEIDNEIGDLSAKRFGVVQDLSRRIRLILVVGGSVVAGIAHFVTGAAAPSAWHIAGIAASVLVGLGAAFMVYTERSAPEELEAARRAIAAARQAERAAALKEQELKDKFQPIEAAYEETDSALKRAVELYNAMLAMRDAVHAVLQQPAPVDIEKMLEALLTASERPLKIAAGFQVDQHWTMAVYIAEHHDDDRRTWLRCIAHMRSVPCEKSRARQWPEGVGAGGVAYATGSEVIVPDLADEDRGNQYHPGERALAHDSARYRSLAAVPVVVNGVERPWGVVIGTCDIPGHFRRTDPLRIHYVEAVRSLASMVALAVAASYRQQIATSEGAARVEPAERPEHETRLTVVQSISAQAAPGGGDNG